MVKPKSWPYLFLIVAFALGGCAAAGPSASPTPTAAPVATVTPMPLLSPTAMLSTATFTVAPTTDMLSQNNAFEQRCADLLTYMPEGAAPPGILVSDDALEGLTLRDFRQGSQRKIAGLTSTVGTSPDGKWLVYGRFEPKPHLVIESPDGKQRSQVAVKADWALPGELMWLDDTRVWFPLSGTDWSVPTQVTAVDLFSGKETRLKSDYPGIQRYAYGPVAGPGYHFDYSSVVYDPSLNLVVYPEFDADRGFTLTLWDRKAGKALARVLSGGDYGNLPVWQADQNRFLVVGYPGNGTGQKEWMAVSPDGTVQQLTHLAEIYPEYQIENNASLSPDGNFLAFGLTPRKDQQDQPTRLILLNLKTLAAVDTCLPLGGPAWSLDSRYLALEGFETKDGQSQLFLYDLKKNQAFHLDEGKHNFPVGWLEQP